MVAARHGRRRRFDAALRTQRLQALLDGQFGLALSGDVVLHGSGRRFDPRNVLHIERFVEGGFFRRWWRMEDCKVRFPDMDAFAGLMEGLDNPTLLDSINGRLLDIGDDSPRAGTPLRLDGRQPANLG